MIPLKIIALIPRLGTSFDGEVIATRNAISRLLKAAGLDWCDLAAACGLVGVVETTPTAGDRRTPGGATFGDIARACRDLDGGQLSPKERAFVGDMVRRGFAFRPSPRQAAWLDDILSRLQGRAAA